MDFQESVFKQVREIHLFGAGSAGAKRCVLRTSVKTFSWKSKMKPVVKYGVYLDILLMGSTYVIKYVFLMETPDFC